MIPKIPINANHKKFLPSSAKQNSCTSHTRVNLAYFKEFPIYEDNHKTIILIQSESSATYSINKSILFSQEHRTLKTIYTIQPSASRMNTEKSNTQKSSFFFTRLTKTCAHGAIHAVYQTYDENSISIYLTFLFLRSIVPASHNVALYVLSRFCLFTHLWLDQPLVNVRRQQR